MSRVVVGKWGKNLAIRVPVDVVRSAGLSDGETVEIETVDGDILIRRATGKAEARQSAIDAAAEIMASSRGRSLNGVSVRELLAEGRRG